MKLLFLDTETSPTIATVWGLFNQNIAINQLIGNSEVLTWVSKWYGEKDYQDGSLMRDGKKKMLKRIHALLDEADAVVTWNGNGFDIKVLNKEFLLQGMPPPAPFKSIDLLATARKKFRFTSNKLDYISQQLGLGSKVKHRGHQMWLDCMNRKREAFDEMLRYNKKDVTLLEKVYKKLLPWVSNHPNHSVFGNTECCPNCGGKKFQKRGPHITSTGTYQRYQCSNKRCGKYFRGAKIIQSHPGFREAA